MGAVHVLDVGIPQSPVLEKLLQFTELEEDMELAEKMSELAEIYFDDMRLEKGSIVENFFWVTVENEEMDIEDRKKIENGEWEDWKIENGKVCHYELPDEIRNVLDVNNFCYIVDELEEGTLAVSNRWREKSKDGRRERFPTQ